MLNDRDPRRWNATPFWQLVADARPTSALVATALVAASLVTFGGSQSVLAAVDPDDIDGDGISNSVDVDDDNDGILDTVESDCSISDPAGFNTLYPANSPLQGFAQPLSFHGGALLFEPELGGNAAWSDGVQYHDLGVGPTIFVQPNTMPNYDPTGTVGDYTKYTLTFPTPVANLAMRGGGLNNEDGTTLFATGPSGPLVIDAENFTNLNPVGATGMFLRDFIGSGGTAGTDGVFETVEGTSTAGGVDVDSNLYQLNLAGPVSEITIVTGKTDNSNGNVTLGFYALTFCAPIDTDSDGIPDHQDVDTDNDGISDIVESGADATALDPDGNGVIDGAQATDTDGDGLADVAVTGTDVDGLATGTTPANGPDADGVQNWRDLDSDGDGIPDTIEGRPTGSYAVNDGDVRNNDADGDGVIDLFDPNDTTTAVVGGLFPSPTNSDGDSTPDYLDLNSDNDPFSDAAEGGSTVSGVTFLDPDGSVTDPAADLPNEFGDTSEVAYREVPPPPLTLIKSVGSVTDDGDGMLGAGDVVNYTFSVTNAGTEVINNLTLTDTFATVSGGPLATLGIGATDSTTFTASHVITPTDVSNGGVENRATINGTSPIAGSVSDVSDTGTNPNQSPVADPAGTETPSPLGVNTNDPLDAGEDPTTLPIGPPSDLDFSKTVSPTGTVNPGDTLTYTLITTNTGSAPLTGVTVADSVPTGTAFVPASGSVTGPIAFDDFSSGGFTSGQGWTGDWTEVGDDGSPAGAADGTCGGNGADVCILTDGVSGSEVLRVENDNNGAYRQVDLTSASAADLVYDFRRTDLVDVDQWVAVYASATPPTNGARGTEIFRHAGGPVTDAAFAANTVSLDAFAGAPVYVSVFGNNGGMAQTNGVQFDDVRIDATRVPSDPPTLATTPVLPPGTTATYTFAVIVDSPRPAALASIDNTAIADSNETPSRQASTSNPLPAIADIGGTVYDDVEQDEVIGAGDAPIPSVTVQLFQDADGNGVADGPAIATTMTLADGSYTFENIGSGTYLVVETDPTGLASVSDTDGGNDNTISVTLDGTGTDNSGNDFLDTGLDFGDGPGSYGSASAVTNSELFLGAGVTRDAVDRTDDTDADDGVDLNDAVVTTSGYALPVAVTNSTGGSVWVCGWIDLDKSGTFEAGEQQCDEVLDGESEATLTWTDVGDLSGNSFSRFRVASTLAEAQLATGPTSAGEVEDYPINLATLPVTVAYFSSEQVTGGVDITWWSGTETGNAGYVLYGENKDGRTALTDLIVGAGDSFTPLEYTKNVPSGFSTLWLADVDLEGHETLHGPYHVGETVGSIPAPVVLDWDTSQAEVDQVAVADEAERTDDQNHATAVSMVSTVINATVADAKALFTTSAAPFRSTVVGAGNAAVVSVDTAGIYRVSSNDLLDIGLNWRNVRMDSLAVIDSAGEPVPIRTSGGKKFRNNRFVEFLGEPLDTLYTGTNVYRLVVDPSKRVLMDIDKSRVRLRQDAATSSLHTTVAEEQNFYSAAAPGDDPWHAADIFSWSPPQDTVIELDHVAAGAGSISVTVWGALDFAPEIDHKVSVAVNGSVVGDVEFGGLNEAVVTATLPDGLLVEGANTVSVTVGLAPGMPFDWVNLDRVELSYPRDIVAVDGTASFTASADRIVVSGLTALAVEILRVDEDGEMARVRRTKLIEEIDGTFTISFAGTGAEASYIVTQIDSLITPDIAAARIPSGLLDGSADLLIISHSAFRDHLGDLVAEREAQGLAVKVVEVENLYAAYTGEVFDPAAISGYIADAARAFGDPAVLLVGADSRDYRNNGGTDSIAFIPTIYGDVGVGSIAWSPIDPAFVDLDNDLVPDLDLGRFPVRTLVELENAIDKAINYTPDNSAVVASEAGFGDIADEIVASLPADTSVTTAHLDDLTVADARSVLLDGINDGAGLTVFFGHSSTDQWTAEGLLTTADAADFANTEDPTIVIQFGCWNTYFSDPTQQSLGSALLTEQGGASAVLGATTLTSAVHDAMFGPSLMDAVAASATIGAALTAAKQDFASSMSAPDITMGWTLLGDPTTPLD